MKNLFHFRVANINLNRCTLEAYDDIGSYDRDVEKYNGALGALEKGVSN